MSVEKNSNLNTHCDLQPNFQNVFKNIPPNKRHNFFFLALMLHIDLLRRDRQGW